MNDEESLTELCKMIYDLDDIEKIKTKAKELLDRGVEPKRLIDAISHGLEEIGNRYESGEYFLSELIMGGIIGSEIINVLTPYLKSVETPRLGKVVIGTVKGDLHDIGKNLVVSMLRSSGFEVVDLGIDVPAQKFIDAVRKEEPEILAMSCLLTMAMDEMKRVIDELKRHSLRDKVKIIIGGRPTSLEFARRIGADAWGRDAVEAVKVAKTLLGR
ncbi:MAG TPA: cobalamin-binding protein [Candidatus Bathyarchaeota archaeon]|nr:cobalamin-binding protein [Candidatus Bathyarchaeota archaeon]